MFHFSNKIRTLGATFQLRSHFFTIQNKAQLLGEVLNLIGERSSTRVAPLTEVDYYKILLAKRILSKYIIFFTKFIVHRDRRKEDFENTGLCLKALFTFIEIYRHFSLEAKIKECIYKYILIQEKSALGLQQEEIDSFQRLLLARGWAQRDCDH